MNSFTRAIKVFAKSLGNLAYDFWEDCFYKPKIVTSCKQANLFEYINECIKNSRSPDPSRAIVFYMA